MKTMYALGKAGNRVQTHFAAYELVKQEEPVSYQPSRSSLWVLLALMFSGALIFGFALYGVCHAVSEVMKGFGL